MKTKIFQTLTCATIRLGAQATIVTVQTTLPATPQCPHITTETTGVAGLVIKSTTYFQMLVTFFRLNVPLRT